MDNDLKKKLLKMRGTVTDQEVEYMSNLVPKTNSQPSMIKSIAGSQLSDRELEYLKKKLMPKGVK
jgi:hypothetical protein